MTTTLVTPGQFTVEVGLTDPPDIDVTCEVAAFDLQSNPQTITVPASFCADGYDDVSSVTTSLVLTVLCDWDTGDSLAWFLRQNGGKQGFVAVTKTGAAAGAGPGWVANVRFVKPNLTLSTGAAAQVDVTLPVFGVVDTVPAVTP